MIDEPTKAQQLREIEELERPFLRGAQVGSGPGAQGDRVTVVAPDGTIGTIPRSNLQKALRRGYKQQANQ
jgi:hypothetical protein